MAGNINVLAGEFGYSPMRLIQSRIGPEELEIEEIRKKEIRKKQLEAQETRQIEKQKDREQERLLARLKYEQDFQAMDTQRNTTWGRYEQVKEQEGIIRAQLKNNLESGNYLEAGKLNGRIRSLQSQLALLYFGYMHSTSRQINLALNSFH